MTPKWTIKKYSKTWPDDGPVWVVTAPDVRLVQEKMWVNNFLPSDRYKYCDTFAEAIAWATRKTRTVEVELPKVVRKAYIDPRPFAEMAVIDKGEHGVQILFSDDHFRLLDSDLKPLGEYLLALHYEKENK